MSFCKKLRTQMSLDGRRREERVFQAGRGWKGEVERGWWRASRNVPVQAVVMKRSEGIRKKQPGSRESIKP